MTPTDESPSAATELGTFGRRAAGFVLIGVVLYVGLYVASERIIAEYAQRNRFYMVQTAPQARYDHVILGASHAAVFDYRDMNARLEAMTGARILNLSIVGAGITVNRLLLDYFLTEHHTDSVVYVLDSFGFYSAEWNEDRLQDAALLHRAPFDPALAWLLLRNPATRAVARDYVVGFSKINNPDRFVPDVLEGEGNRFDRTYRPVAQIDRQRIAYLYPNAIDDATLQDSPYLAALEDLIGEVQSRDIRMMVIRPPIPARIYAMIPGEAQFDATLQALLDRYGVELHNFSLVDNDEEFYFDSDHLNQTGVLRFYESHLAELLASSGAVGWIGRRTPTERCAVRTRRTPARATNQPRASPTAPLAPRQGWSRCCRTRWSRDRRLPRLPAWRTPHAAPGRSPPPA